MPDERVSKAVFYGATFNQESDGTWTCIAKKRGRPQPIATFNDKDQGEAAAMFLRYFGHKQ